MKPESVLSDNDYKRVFGSLITNPDREAFLRSCIDEYLPANPRFFVLLELVCRERLSPEWESVNQFSIANPNVPIDELKSVRHKDLESVLRLIVATDQQMRYGAIYDRLTAIVREHLPNYPTGHNWSWLNELEPYLGRCKQWSDLLSMYTDQPEIINAKIDKWLEPLLDTQAEAWEEYKRAALINDQPSKIKEIEDGKIMRQIEPELMRRSFQMADFQLQVYRDFLEGLRPKEGKLSRESEPLSGNELILKLFLSRPPEQGQTELYREVASTVPKQDGGKYDEGSIKGYYSRWKQGPKFITQKLIDRILKELDAEGREVDAAYLHLVTSHLENGI